MSMMASEITSVLIVLSHTWVRYPGFSGHGVKCPILTTVVPGFSGDLIGCTIRSKWGSFGDLYLARKNLLCVRNKLFLVEIKFSQRRTRPVKSLWWQSVHMQESTNEWKNQKFFKWWDLREHNGKTSNSEEPIDKIYIEILEIFQDLKNVTRFNLKLFYQI